MLLVPVNVAVAVLGVPPEGVRVCQSVQTPPLVETKTANEVMSTVGLPAGSVGTCR